MTAHLEIDTTDNCPDLAAIERLTHANLTLLQFTAALSLLGVDCVVGGDTVTSAELRGDYSRYFADIDHNLHVTGGRFA